VLEQWEAEEAEEAEATEKSERVEEAEEADTEVNFEVEVVMLTHGHKQPAICEALSTREIGSNHHQQT
jgi:hypothetical protein